MRHIALACLGLPTWALAGCGVFDSAKTDEPQPYVDPNADADADADADSDSDADADADSDTDADADADADSGDTGGDDFCDLALTPPATIDACVTAEVGCGGTVLSTTQSGTYNFSGEGYRNWFCTPAGNSEYTGQERVYAFTKPTGVAATLTLDSPCEQLHLFALEYNGWANDGTCPSPDALLSRCEFDGEREGGVVTLVADDRDYDYLIVVDGPTGVDANFELSVECD